MKTSLLLLTFLVVAICAKRIRCPASEGQLIAASNGGTFKIECATERQGDDLYTDNTSSFEKCVELCAVTKDCEGVSYDSPKCDLKSSLTNVQKREGSWSAVATTFLAKTSAYSAKKSNGCGQTLPKGLSPGGKSQTQWIVTQDGKNRTFLVHLPKSYDPNSPNPLLFSFHGQGGTSKSQESDTQFSDGSVNPKYIAVYPQGYKNSWEGAPYATKGLSDIDFVQQLIDHLSTTLCVDSNRLYASGHSNGGGFTSYLACNQAMSTKFAAFGANSAALYQGQNEKNCNADKVAIKCNLGRKNVPYMEIHGTSDSQISYTGGAHNGECLPSIPHYVQNMVSLQQLDPKNTSTGVGGKSVMFQWGKSPEGKVGIVTHVRVAGGAHVWPRNFNGFSASPTVLKFFDTWTLTTPL